MTGFESGIVGSTGGGAPVIFSVPLDTVRTPVNSVTSRISIVPEPTFATAPSPTRLPAFTSSKTAPDSASSTSMNTSVDSSGFAGSGSSSVAPIHFFIR